MAKKNMTYREKQVIKLLCDGKSRKEIAGKLRITLATVNNHIRSIQEKSDVASASQVIAIEYQELLEKYNQLKNKEEKGTK